MRKSVTLECSAINVNKSITRLDYQWQKEFVDISGASKNTYETLEPGSYRCKITNGYRTVYTQDAIVTLEPIWVTDIIINTQSITNSGKIQYTINPEEADDKTITFDTKITPEYTIDTAGNVTINKDGCSFEVVARSQFGKGYLEVTGTKTITGYTRVAVKSITIITTTIQDAGQIQTSVSPENASIVKKEFELLSGSEYVVMNSTGYVSEVISPGTFSVRVSGFDKAGNVVTNTKSIAATNEFVKITGVSITTDTINEGGTITYNTIPPSVPANLKSVMIELYNQGNSEYVDVNIDSNGKVTGITEDMDGKKFKAKITVVDKYDNTVSNTKEITCEFRILVTNIEILKSVYIDGDHIRYNILPSNATNKTVKISLKSSNSNVNITTGGYIKVYGDTAATVVISAQDGSGVSAEKLLYFKVSGNYFIAETARGDKTGRGSWDNATDDITSFYYKDGEVWFDAYNVYVQKNKICDLQKYDLHVDDDSSYVNEINGGCVIGEYNSNSTLIKSGLCNFTTGNIRSLINDFNIYNFDTFILRKFSNNDYASISKNCNIYNGEHVGIDTMDNFTVYDIENNTSSSGSLRLGTNSVDIARVGRISNSDVYNIINNCVDTRYGDGCDMYNVSCINCNFYNISSLSKSCLTVRCNGNSGDGFGTCTFDKCNIHDIYSSNKSTNHSSLYSYGLIFNMGNFAITNCVFSAIESNDSTKYTSYSDLIKILPPETGCRFLPEGKAQSIRFDDSCIINGKKVSDLLNTPTNPTITITPDSLTDSGTIAYTITPETSCQFAIINGTFDAVEIGATENVTIDGETMWFVGAKTIDIASVKYDSNLVVRVSCMDGSGYYVDKTIPVTTTAHKDDYFIAKTARGNKTGRGSWSNATDDIKTFAGSSGTIMLDTTYIETGKVCDIGGNQLDLDGSIIGGCEFGTFVPKSINDRSDFYNISSGFDGVNIVSVSAATITNCEFYNISSRFYCVKFVSTSATIANCDFYNISGGVGGVDFVDTPATIANCDFYNISGDGADFGDEPVTIISCNFHDISGYGAEFTNTPATITNCDFYNISGNGTVFKRSSAIITNCDFYNISGYGAFFSGKSAIFTDCNFYDISGYGADFSNTSATIISCNFHDISDCGISFLNTSAIITNCEFYNISVDNSSGNSNYWGIYMRNTSATIENCIFSAIESNDSTNSTKYTPYSSLIKILPPETGCRFLPEDEAQSIYFSNDCVINGRKVSDLLNS